MYENTQADAADTADPGQGKLEGIGQTLAEGDRSQQLATENHPSNAEPQPADQPEDEPASVQIVDEDKLVAGIDTDEASSDVNDELTSAQYVDREHLPNDKDDEGDEAGLTPSLSDDVTRENIDPGASSSIDDDECFAPAVSTLQPEGTHKPRFRIKSGQPAYVPGRMSRPNQDETCLYQSDFRSAMSEHNQEYALYIQHTAFKKVQEHIGWGRDTSVNQVEQGGILLGDAFVDEEDRVFGIVNDAVAGELAQGSAAYLEISHESWKDMFDRVDRLRQNRDGAHILGWYHTHPRLLDVFMSGTDRNTQGRLFGMDWQFAIVLNPQRRIWRVFRGSSVQECRGCVGNVSVVS